MQDHKVRNLQQALPKGGKYMSLLAVFSLLHNLPTSSFYQTYCFCPPPGPAGGGWATARLRGRQQHRTAVRRVTVTQCTCSGAITQCTWCAGARACPDAPGAAHTPRGPRAVASSPRDPWVVLLFRCRNAAYLVHTELWREVL